MKRFTAAMSCFYEGVASAPKVSVSTGASGAGSFGVFGTRRARRGGFQGDSRNYFKPTARMPMVNPGFPKKTDDLSWRNNCVSVVLAAVNTLRGVPSVAEPVYGLWHMDGGSPLNRITENLGGSFDIFRPISAVQSRLSERPPGTIGIVYCQPRNPEEPGHVFNAIVCNDGSVRLWDFQSNAKPTLDGYRAFSLLVVPEGALHAEFAPGGGVYPLG